MVSRSVHGELQPGHDIRHRVRVFGGSRRSFKRSRSARKSPSGHFDRQSYGGGKGEGRSGCIVERGDRGLKVLIVLRAHGRLVVV